MFLFIEKNPWLSGKTKEEIMSLDYRFFVGMKSTVKHYDMETGVKTHQDYVYEDKQGKLHLVIRQFYEDVYDIQTGDVKDCKTKTFWYGVLGEHIVKEERLHLSQKKLYDLIASRKKRVLKTKPSVFSFLKKMFVRFLPFS